MRTPPLKRILLQLQNMGRVDTLWCIEIVDQFAVTGEFTLPVVMTLIGGDFVEQVVFLALNHRGPLPLKEIHSADEIRVSRDPGGS